MECSIINKSQTVSDFRIDAECYKKEYLEIDSLLKNMPHTTIGDEVKKFCKGIFDIKAECYSNEGVPFVRILNLKEMMIDDSQYVCIPEEQNDKYKNSFLSYGDLILSKTAYPAASLVTLPFCNTSQDTIAVKLKKKSKIKSHYLVLFLNCKYGYLQMRRWFTGNVQMHLNLLDSRTIIIPLLSDSFQEIVEKEFEHAIDIIKLSKSTYQQAENLLLSELGLSNWLPQHQLSFISDYSTIQKAERFDAEYFQPKCNKLIDAIKAYPNGYDSVGKLLVLKDKNFEPEAIKEYCYIELSNIVRNGEIIDCIHAEGRELPTRARRKVSSGDVIVSTIEGSLASIALIPDEFNNALCSNGFFVVNSSQINPETLLVLMKSIVGQLQLKKGCNGTILTAINKEEFKKITLPIIGDTIQDQIRQKVTESFKLRKQSKSLLECAKKAVELAIEKDEDSAMKWLEAQKSLD
jgi:restriction endonuclease S subunit